MVETYSNNLEAKIDSLMSDYGLESTVTKEDLFAYGNSVAAAAVATMLEEAKSNGKLEAIMNKKASFADLMDVSGGGADYVELAKKAERAAKAAWLNNCGGESASPEEYGCCGNAVVEMMDEALEKAVPKRRK